MANESPALKVFKDRLDLYKSQMSTINQQQAFINQAVKNSIRPDFKQQMQDTYDLTKTTPGLTPKASRGNYWSNQGYGAASGAWMKTAVGKTFIMHGGVRVNQEVPPPKPGKATPAKMETLEKGKTWTTSGYLDTDKIKAMTQAPPLDTSPTATPQNNPLADKAKKRTLGALT